MLSERILVVDDEEPIREIVTSMLANAGYECKQAGSGLEALAILESGEQFELMLYPKSRHGVSEPLLVKHMRQMMTDFILENL